MKPNPSTLRPFGQAALPSSFLSKSPKKTTQSKASKQSISLSDSWTESSARPPTVNPFSKETGVNFNGSWQGKQSSFSSIGSKKEELGSRGDEVGCGFALNRAIFQQFNRPEKEDDCIGASNGSEGGGKHSRKRKSSSSSPSDNIEKSSTSRSLLVLGDDPQPKPKRRQRNVPDKRSKSFYNHYENGCGWWDGDREGIDSEEVGFNEVWEGMGSTTLGGLEWH